MTAAIRAICELTRAPLLPAVTLVCSPPLPRFAPPVSLDITHCPACGLPKLHAHLCTNCLATVRRDLKNAKRIQEHLALEAAKKAALAEGKELVEPHAGVRLKNYLETGNPAPAPKSIWQPVSGSALPRAPAPAADEAPSGISGSS